MSSEVRENSKSKGSIWYIGQHGVKLGRETLKIHPFLAKFWNNLKKEEKIYFRRLPHSKKHDYNLLSDTYRFGIL
jgi:hypothetical protein